MKLKRIIVPLFTLFVLGSLWYYQATERDKSFRFEIPQWVAGGNGISYSVTIHKNQIHPYGTIWKTIIGDMSITSYPLGSRISRMIFDPTNKQP